MKKRIGFIGCGNMGSAMLAGILKKGIFAKEEIIVSHLTEDGLRRSKEKYGVYATLDNKEAVRNAEIIFLAIKPQFYEQILDEIKTELCEEQILVSLAPGKTMEWLENRIGKKIKAARLMPNTPAQVGEGMTGACCNERMTEKDIRLLKSITDSFGKTEFVPEHLMDAVVAASGSSPAYVYIMIEAMADAVVSLGMPRKQAYAFVSQAVLGSAKMVLETGRHPGELKDMVCSPAGTTIEGVRTLEKAGFRSAVYEALKASADKGKQL